MCIFDWHIWSKMGKARSKGEYKPKYYLHSIQKYKNSNLTLIAFKDFKEDPATADVDADHQNKFITMIITGKHRETRLLGIFGIGEYKPRYENQIQL